MKTLDRGFKAWAERTSTALRRELKATIDDPVSPARFADYFGIELWTPEHVPNITPEILNQLLEVDPWGWSATSFQTNGKSVIIYNPKHSIGRQASDITHEISHNVLEHRPATIIVSLELADCKMRSFDQKQEDEANCLAWTLLLPREGLLRAKLKRKSIEEIALQFGVTNTLVKYRLNSTGIEKQLQKAARW